jgi:hypothetical protein
MSHRQQPDNGAAGVLLAITGQQRFEGTSIGAAREELLAIDQIEFVGFRKRSLAGDYPAPLGF